MKFYDYYFDEYIISSLFFSFFTHDLFKSNSSLFYMFFYNLLQENRDKETIIDFTIDLFKKIKHLEKTDGYPAICSAIDSSDENTFYIDYLRDKNRTFKGISDTDTKLRDSQERSDGKTPIHSPSFSIKSHHQEFIKYFFPFFTLPIHIPLHSVLADTLSNPKMNLSERSVDKFEINTCKTTDIMNIEMNHFFNKKNNSLDDFNNYIIYGPPSSGKYSQSLLLFFLLSPSLLKYQKKILLQNDKFKFFFFISDIHYEIDISLLGCNSKLIWADLFSYIIDMISVNPLKKGIILCKNFESIHNELLDTFYSYMQHYNHNLSNIKISFVIITENISFIPNNIINICNVLSIPKPDLNIHEKILNIIENSPSFISEEHGNMETEDNLHFSQINENSLPATENCHESVPDQRDKVDFFQKISTTSLHNKKINLHSILKSISDIDDLNTSVPKLNNIKEIHTVNMLKSKSVFSEQTNSFIEGNKNVEMPKNLLNMICDGIIHEMINYQKINMLKFRDMIYDILIYNLNVYECVWYIIEFFVEWDNPVKKSHTEQNKINQSSAPFRSVIREGGIEPKNEFIGIECRKIKKILKKTHTFLKHYNNNYRPIYHLEHFFYYMLVIIHDI